MSLNVNNKSKIRSKFEIAIIIFLVVAVFLTLLGLIFVLFSSRIPQTVAEGLTGEKFFELKIRSLSTQIEVFEILAIMFVGFAILFNFSYTANKTDTFEKNTLVAIDSVQEVEQGKITDRFTKAIEQLGSENPTIRIGGIYALERMANNLDMAPWTIVELLTAFVREKAAFNQDFTQPNTEDEKADRKIKNSQIQDYSFEENPQKEENKTVRSRLAIDIQTALTVIGRRDTKTEQEDQIIDLRHTNILGADIKKANLQRAILTQSNLQGAILFGANLQGAILYGVNLAGAILLGADLQGAILTESNLQGAVFTESNLQGAVFWKANLQDANLTETDLTGAILYGANLQGANLKEANLQGAILTEANLEGAILSRAENLEQHQIESALGDSNTVLPKYIARPEKWKQSESI